MGCSEVVTNTTAVPEITKQEISEYDELKLNSDERIEKAKAIIDKYVEASIIDKTNSQEYIFEVAAYRRSFAIDMVTTDNAEDFYKAREKSAVITYIMQKKYPENISTDYPVADKYLKSVYDEYETYLEKYQVYDKDRELINGIDYGYPNYSDEYVDFINFYDEMYGFADDTEINWDLKTEALTYPYGEITLKSIDNEYLKDNELIKNITDDIYLADGNYTLNKISDIILGYISEASNPNAYFCGLDEYTKSTDNISTNFKQLAYLLLIRINTVGEGVEVAEEDTYEARCTANYLNNYIKDYSEYLYDILENADNYITRKDIEDAYKQKALDLSEKYPIGY